MSETSILEYVCEKFQLFCRRSLQKAVEDIAMGDSLVGGILILISLLEVFNPKIPLWSDPWIIFASSKLHKKKELSAIFMRMAWGGILFFEVIQVIFGVCLLKAAKRRSLETCQIWFFVQLSLLLIECVVLITFLGFIKNGLIFTVILILSCTYKTYTLWIIKKFVDEVRNEIMPDDLDEEEVTEKSFVT